ncbi:MAG: hypothetical protein FGM46_05085 [Ferruginibacter sp.]|nr:hypothetical protein [Ferruginibacter sp.]
MKKILPYLFLLMLMQIFCTTFIKQMQDSAYLEMNDGKATETDSIDEIVEEGLEDDVILHFNRWIIYKNLTLCRESVESCLENTPCPVIPPPPEV